jgi:hypothetical protein
MKTVYWLIAICLLFVNVSFSQSKKFNSIKYIDCLYDGKIDFNRPKKYFEESNKYLQRQIVVITTNETGKIIRRERGYIKNYSDKKSKSIWFECHPEDDSTRVMITFAFPVKSKNKFYYFADCYDSK